MRLARASAVAAFLPNSLGSTAILSGAAILATLMLLPSSLVAVAGLTISDQAPCSKSVARSRGLVRRLLQTFYANQRVPIVTVEPLCKPRVCIFRRYALAAILAQLWEVHKATGKSQILEMPHDLANFRVVVSCPESVVGQVEIAMHLTTSSRAEAADVLTGAVRAGAKREKFGIDLFIKGER